MARGQNRKKKVPGTRVLLDGTYEAILVVPADCQDRVGKKNLTRRLGTTLYSDAKRLAPPILREFELVVERARAGASAPAEPVDPRKAVRAIEQWRAAELSRAELRAFNQPDEEIPDPQTYWSEHSAYRLRYYELRDGLSRQGRWADIAGFDEKLLGVLDDQGIRLSGTHPAMTRLRPIFQAAWCDVVKYEDDLRSGAVTPGETSNAAVAQSVSTASQFSDHNLEGTVWDAFVAWRTKRERDGGDAGKTAREFETQVKRFIDVHGDLRLGQITRRHCIEFRNLMAQYPASVPTAMRSESVRTVVARYTAKGQAPYKRLAAKTLNEKVFAALRAVFADAAIESENFVNPMLNISVETTKSAPTKLPYNDREVGALFASDVFRGKLVRDKRAGGDAQKWIPLLAAYSGARLEELGQLAVTDIKEEDGVHYMHIQERYDGPDPGYLRSLKNEASQRKVPIHSALLELGFLQFVDAQRSAGNIHVFSSLKWDDKKKRDKSYKVTASLSKWWSAYSRLVVPDTRKSFHSFRHTFKNRLRNAGVAKALDDALTGHISSDEGDRYGRDQEGLGFRLPILADAIEQLSHPNIDVRAIR
ncbi:site-specific integrase [Terricaulis silvestris]|uniref:Site-specific recombinase XerD n=1 Tax=Terricaulis silvestris TaxID=2686094 RepID=A0A6I6MGE4_9CAUL|nr:site-specific integrase [Terricaulis silvestris]QGZ93329.1 Site-specific recombinase XerD [Terricaulis silvestris]